MGKGIITHIKCHKLNSIFVIILVTHSFFTLTNELMDLPGKKRKKWSHLINTQRIHTQFLPPLTPSE